MDFHELDGFANEGLIPIDSEHNGRKFIWWGENILAAIGMFPSLKWKITLLNDSTMFGYRPHLSDYLCYHGTIDVLCWLLRLRYSPRETIKKRNYRLHVMFDGFLAEQQFDLNRLSDLAGSHHSQSKFAFHLNKGWYNELVRSYPLDADFLNIGTKHDPSHSKGRSLSWNVTQSYYSIYEYVNALVFTNTDDLKTEQHRKSTRHFNATLLGKFSGRLIPYPFNLTNPLLESYDGLRGKTEKFWGFQYATYPRDGYRSIFELEKSLVKLIEAEGNILDFLYDFRVWANYLGIETILALEDGYFLTYLYKNLGILSFFYGCFAEIMALSFLGEEVTVHLLEQIATKFILKQDNFRDHWYLVPMFIRFRLYRKHGLLKNDLPFLAPSNVDPLADLMATG